MAMPRKVHTVESLLARTDEFGDCLIWNGYSFKNTPYVSADGAMTSVRGLLWKLQGKKAPEGRVFYRAVCEQDRCVCPQHIRCETADEHMKRMAQPERRTAAGEALRAARISRRRRKNSRVTPEVLQTIMQSDESGPALSAKLGISRQLISQYRRGRLGATRASNPFQGLGAR